MDKSVIPIRLREARKMCGYSLDQLVKVANLRVTRQSIYNYERGVCSLNQIWSKLLQKHSV